MPKESGTPPRDVEGPGSIVGTSGASGSRTPPGEYPWLSSLEHFLELVTARLKMGAERYGDAALEMPPRELRREIDEELLDVVAWSFLLWLRLRALQDISDS